MTNFYLKISFACLALTGSAETQASENPDYGAYHQRVMAIERQIVEGAFANALEEYQHLFDQYEFIPLRDLQVATQLALYVNQEQIAIQLLQKGILAGWEWRAIKKRDYLAPLRDDPEWTKLKEKYKSLRKTYEAGLDQKTRKQVKKMFAKDQWKALGSLFRIGDRAQRKYAERKFAPHSEKQIRQLMSILEEQGYPGERLIGNNFWMSTIISHHNSISVTYNRTDTLFTYLRPKLLQAIKAGQLSPYEFAMIDDWHKAVSSERTVPGYGFLNPPNRSTLSITNELRNKIGLRTVERRNQLIEVEQKTGMRFYLPDWIEGKIKIED